MTVAEMDRLVRLAFVRHGLSRDNAARLLACGWINGRAAPTLHDVAPGMLHADADNGFAQVALALATPRLIEKARAAGVASLSIANSHHLAALWPDVEPFARQGFVALTVVNSRSLMVAWEGQTKIIGTNPHGLRMPGDRRYARRSHVEREGIDISDTDAALLHTAAEER